MTTINISIPEPMKKFVDAQIAHGSYSTVSEYIRELVRRDQKRASDDEVERKLIAGLESGAPLKGDSKYWDKKKTELAARLAKGHHR